MLIGILQTLTFVFAGLLVTAWRGFVRDEAKLKLGVAGLIGSIAISGLSSAWIGTPGPQYYYDRGAALVALLFFTLILLIFLALLTTNQSTTQSKSEDV
jgi:hypothetical protein